MRLNSFLGEHLGKAQMVKLFVSDRRDVTLILEYTPLSLRDNEVDLRIRTQMRSRDTALYRRLSHRQEVGQITVSTETSSLGQWYVTLAETTLKHLEAIEHAPNENAFAKWASYTALKPITYTLTLS